MDILSLMTKYTQSVYSSMSPAGKPIVLFKEDFAILSCDPFKFLILNNQKSYWEGRELNTL